MWAGEEYKPHKKVRDRSSWFDTPIRVVAKLNKVDEPVKVMGRKVASGDSRR